VLKEEGGMFLVIAAVLVLLWFFGFIGHVAGNLAYVFLVLALAAVIFHFVGGHGHSEV
jgi:p-aminobenzoyl-glutamate transporter AbgT